MSRSADLARLERLLAAVPGVVWEADARSRRLLYVSDAARDLIGTPSQLLVADPVRAWELVHPDDRSAIVDAVERAAEGGLERVRFRVLATTGGLLWLQSSVQLLDDGILGGLVHDLGDEIRAELHLSVQRALTQAIAGSAALEEAAEAIVGELCRAFDWGVGA